MYYFPNYPWNGSQFMMPLMYPQFFQPLQSTFVGVRNLPQEQPVKLQSLLNQHQNHFSQEKPIQADQEPEEQEKASQQIQNRPKKGLHFFRQFSIAKNLIGKNTRSNLLRYFLMYLEDCIEVTDKVEKIIKAHGLEISKEDFKEMSKGYVKHTKYYFKPKTFSNLCRQLDCKKDFAVVFRVLLRMFLKMDLAIFIRKSPRLRRKTKLSYLYIAKKLSSELLKVQKKRGEKKN